MPVTLDKDQYTKAEAEDLIRQSDEAHAEALEVAKLEGTMTDAQKEIYKSLEGDDKSEFLFATADERESQVTKAVDDDPVIYTSAGGAEFRKSDDPRLVNMAKERDTERKDFLKLQADRSQETFEKRAEDELPNLPGTVKTRAAILKAVEGIEDKDTRKEAVESIKAHNAKMADAFTQVGSTGIKKVDDVNQGAGGGRNAFTELDQLAKDMVKEHPEISYYDAFEKVSADNADLAKRAVEEG